MYRKVQSLHLPWRPNDSVLWYTVLSSRGTSRSVEHFWNTLQLWKPLRLPSRTFPSHCNTVVLYLLLIQTISQVDWPQNEMNILSPEWVYVGGLLQLPTSDSFLSRSYFVSRKKTSEHQKKSWNFHDCCHGEQNFFNRLLSLRRRVGGELKNILWSQNFLEPERFYPIKIKILLRVRIPLLLDS